MKSETEPELLKIQNIAVVWKTRFRKEEKNEVGTLNIRNKKRTLDLPSK